MFGGSFLFTGLITPDGGDEVVLRAYGHAWREHQYMIAAKSHLLRGGACDEVQRAMPRKALLAQCQLCSGSRNYLFGLQQSGVDGAVKLWNAGAA